jgi:hypothetical protein
MNDDGLLSWFLFREKGVSHAQASRILDMPEITLQNYGRRYLKLTTEALVVGGQGKGNQRRYTPAGLAVFKFAYELSTAGVETVAAFGYGFDVYAALFSRIISPALIADEPEMEIAEKLHWTAALILPVPGKKMTAEIELHDMRKPIDARHLMTGGAPLGYFYVAGPALTGLMAATWKELDGADAADAEPEHRQMVAALERGECA